MRVMCRLPSGIVATMWLREGSLVSELREALAESQCVRPHEGFLRVLHGAQELNDTSELAPFLTGSGYGVVRVCLKHALRTLRVKCMQPAADSSGVALNPISSIILEESSVSSETSYEMQVRVLPTDEAVPGIVEMQQLKDGSCMFQFRGIQPFAPSTQYVVHVRIEDSGSFEYVFTTRPLAPVRIVATPSAAASPRVVTIERRGPSLFDEVQSRIAVAFEVSHNHVILGGLDAAAVAQLEDGDIVIFSLNSTAAPPDGAIIHADVRQLKWPEYKTAHPCNDACGYYAVCGKLDEEEELRAILDVIAIFGDDDDVDGGAIEQEAHYAQEANDGSAVISEETATSCRCQIASEVNLTSQLITPAWGQGSLHQCFDLSAAMRGEALMRGQEMSQLLRRQGFFFVRLDDATLSALASVHAATDRLWALPSAEKAACIAEALSPVLGYAKREQFQKEIFVSRRLNPAASKDAAQALWPGGDVGIDLKIALDAAFQALALCCATMLPSILLALGVQVEDHQLLESPSFVPYQHRFSRSNLSIFRYYNLHTPRGAADTDDGNRFCHCPSHSDVGLLTIIPTARGAAGLNVYSFEEGRWLDVETNAGGNTAVVFAGETLSFVTGGVVTAASHEVSYPANNHEERASVVFQCLADPHCDLSQLLPGALEADAKSGLLADEFVLQTSLQRISSNFPRAGPEYSGNKKARTSKI